MSRANTAASLPFLLLLMAALATAGKVDKAHELFEEGKYEEAIEILDKRVKRKTDDYRAHRLLGHCHMMREDYTNAITSYLRAAQERPPNIDTHRYLGRAYLKRGHFDSALEAYEMVVMALPEDLEARLQRGFCNLSLKRYDEAILEYTIAYQVDRNSSLALVNLGKLHEHQGNAEAAIFAYERFLKLTPNANLAPQVQEALPALRAQLLEEQVYGKPDPEETPQPGQTSRRPVRGMLQVFPRGTRAALLPLKGKDLDSQLRSSVSVIARSVFFERLGLALMPEADWEEAWNALSEDGPCYSTACVTALAEAKELDKVVVGSVEALGVQQLITLEVRDGATGAVEALATTVRDPVLTPLPDAIEETVVKLGQTALMKRGSR